MKTQLLTLLLSLSSGLLLCQDIHFSQFYNSPLNINPGNTGVFYGDQRLNVGYRTQWNNEVPWQTFTAAYDKKFISRFCEEARSFFSGGILVNYDRSSEVSDLKLININLTGSYTVRIDSSHLFTFGALIGSATRAFDQNLLIWDKQWTGRNFDSSLSSGESFDRDRVTYIETALGLNYRWQRTSRTKLDLGLGIFHVTEPGAGFYDNPDIQLSRRFSMMAVGQFKVHRKLDLQASGLAQFQGAYTEYVLGALARFYVDERPGRQIQVHLGLGYRTVGTPFPILAIQYNNFYGSISYDIDMTDINELKGVRPNTLELHFGYMMTSPKWDPKVCPIY